MIPPRELIEPFGAIMFDLDGTLVDTMPVHYAAYAQVFDEIGLKLTWQDYVRLAGPPAGKAIPMFIEVAGGTAASYDILALHARKKVAFEKRLVAAPPTPLPATQVLRVANGWKPCTIVSSGNRRGVQAILVAMGWGKCFDAVVTGDDVVRGKPDPEPYLRAAAMLGIAPQLCLAFEDAAAGLCSARAAGMTVIDVSAAYFGL